MRARVGVALGLLLVATALGIVLTRGHERLAATNSRVTASGLDLPVPAGQRVCEHGQFVPASARKARVYLSTDGGSGGPLAIYVSIGGREISRGFRPAGFRSGPLTIPLYPPRRDINNATVCIANGGDRHLRFAGNTTPFAPVLPGLGHIPDVIRVDYLRGSHESWLQLTPTVSRRFGLVKSSFFGTWTFWAVLGALALVWVAAVTLVIRSVDR